MVQHGPNEDSLTRSPEGRNERTGPGLFGKSLWFWGRDYSGTKDVLLGFIVGASCRLQPSNSSGILFVMLFTKTMAGRYADHMTERRFRLGRYNQLKCRWHPLL